MVLPDPFDILTEHLSPVLAERAKAANQDPLRPLTEEELAKVEPVSEVEIQKALEEGARLVNRIFEPRVAQPSKWDLRFLKLAEHIAGWSKDPSTQTGAVITQDRKVVSVGFNGFPQGMPDSKELYENREEKYSRIIHCEINSLIFAERSLKGCTLYTWPFASCDRCAVQMLQAGIRRFVFPTLPPDKAERWGASMARAKQFFGEVGAEWLEVNG